MATLNRQSEINMVTLQASSAPIQLDDINNAYNVAEPVLANSLNAVISQIQPESSKGQSTVDLPTEAPVGDWKKYLSGAMSDTQLGLALIVLFIFYCIYILYNAYYSLDRNLGDRDEGEIIRNCTCEDSHRIFYLVLTIACCILWLVFHSCCVLDKLFPPFPKSLIQNLKQKFQSKKDDKTDGDSLHENKLKKTTKRTIARCKTLLRAQHYETYAIGKKKNSEPIFSLEYLKELIKILLSPEFRKKKFPPSQDTESICLDSARDKENPNSGNKENPDSVTKANPDIVTKESPDGGNKENTDSVTKESPDSGIKEKIYHLVEHAQHISLGLFHSFLQVALFLVQLSVVPLLIFQMFDTYTLLCLAERDFCDTASRYKLHLDKTALSFSFYCALMISFLVTRWLNIVPFPWELEDNGCYRRIKQFITGSQAVRATQDN